MAKGRKGIKSEQAPACVPMKLSTESLRLFLAELIKYERLCLCLATYRLSGPLGGCARLLLSSGCTSELMKRYQCRHVRNYQSIASKGEIARQRLKRKSQVDWRGLDYASTLCLYARLFLHRSFFYSLLILAWSTNLRQEDCPCDSTLSCRISQSYTMP